MHVLTNISTNTITMKGISIKGKKYSSMNILLQSFLLYYKILFLLSFPLVREYYQTPFKRQIAQLYIILVIITKQSKNKLPFTNNSSKISWDISINFSLLIVQISLFFYSENIQNLIFLSEPSLLCVLGKAFIKFNLRWFHLLLFKGAISVTR